MNDEQRVALLNVLEHIDLSGVAEHDAQCAASVSTLENMLYPLRAASVYAYFAEKLGKEPADKSLRELELDSNCGCDCKRAIDAAASLLEHLKAAAPTFEEEAQIRAIASGICETYWRG